MCCRLAFLVAPMWLLPNSFLDVTTTQAYAYRRSPDVICFNVSSLCQPQCLRIMNRMLSYSLAWDKKILSPAPHLSFLLGTCSENKYPRSRYFTVFFSIFPIHTFQCCQLPTKHKVSSGSVLHSASSVSLVTTPWHAHGKP